MFVLAAENEDKTALINQINDMIVKISDSNKVDRNNEDSQEIITNHNESEGRLLNDIIGDFNNNKIVPLRSVIVCGACQGDLFNI